MKKKMVMIIRKDQEYIVGNGLILKLEGCPTSTEPSVHFLRNAKYHWERRDD